jgi:diguanylate cyclase
MNLDTDQTIHVLMIDDDEDEFVITRDLLSDLGEGYRLSWFDTFEKGMSEIVKDDYSICLLDFNLGAESGIDFLEEAMSRRCQIPIILLTGRGDYKIDVAAMKAGASDYLDKRQLSPPILERAIRYAIERKKSEDRIRFLAYYDQLTHLPNRMLFYDRLKTAFAAARRHDQMCAVMFLDIDNFKWINDTLGHSRGDLLIQEVANRLLSTIRREDAIADGNIDVMLDTVARLGGDEFTVLLNEITEPSSASLVAERIRRSLATPMVLEGHELSVTVSIGISIYPTDGGDVETVMKNADIAMYKSKSMGKDNFQYFDPEMNDSALKRMSVENELRRALKQDEFVLYYQPIIDLKTDRVAAAEALIRWQHPQRGVILPTEFIPIAEEAGLIYDIGLKVFDLLKRDLASWRRDDLRPTVAINISPKQLSEKSLVPTVKRFVSETGVAPGQLTLEITESGIIHNLEEARAVVDEIKQAGIRIALDDFGSGYTSFVLLRQMPFDILKIDRSLITKVPTDAADATIVESLIAIGRSMRIEVIAEGIEEEAQRDLLEQKGCERGQGFLFSHPLPMEEFTKLLRRESAPPGDE